MFGKRLFFHQENRWAIFFIGLTVLVNFSGLFVTLIDPDAAVYASVSKNMVLRNNYLELFFQGKDWLDKPHFPFWITAFFFKLFGIHTWSYKLPAVFFVLLGAWYTYLFAKKYYNKTTALWSAFILLTAEHIIISNNDVRAEPYLTGLIIAAVYHFSNSITKKNAWHLVAASFFAACAVMTKGLFTLIPIGSAVLGEIIIKKKWKELFSWKWLIAGILIVLFISPELYSLWYQFDQHPEKTVLRQKGISGIRFFLWDSQFGRFLNTGPIKGEGDPFFFLHTLLWTFLPWSIIMYISIFEKIRSKIRKKNYLQEEWFTLSGSLFTLLIFSLSQFQLPYYTNIIFPFLAVLTAQYIGKIQQTQSKYFRIIQNLTAVILLAGGILLQYFYSPVIHSFILPTIIVGLIFLLIVLPFWVKLNANLIAFFRACFASLILNFYLNSIFYPDLLKYQSSSEAAFYINEKYPGVAAVRFNVYAPAFEFYLKNSLIKADTATIKMQSAQAHSGLWYVSEDELDFINKSGAGYEIIKELPEFHVSLLTPTFINKKTRNQELKKYFIIRLK